MLRRSAAVEQLRAETQALAATVERLRADVAMWQELAAPGPERSLMLGARGASADARGRRRVLSSLGVGPYVDLLAISSITFEAYAAHHGYDLRLATELLDPERPPAWSKIVLVRQLLERYDEVLWVDADAIFLDISEDIAGLVHSDKDLYLVEHVYEEDESWRSANTGVFLVRSTRWARRFLGPRLGRRAVHRSSVVEERRGARPARLRAASRPHAASQGARDRVRRARGTDRPRVEQHRGGLARAAAAGPSPRPQVRHPGAPRAAAGGSDHVQATSLATP